MRTKLKFGIEWLISLHFFIDRGDILTDAFVCSGIFSAYIPQSKVRINRNERKLVKSDLQEGLENVTSVLAQIQADLDNVTTTLDGNRATLDGISIRDKFASAEYVKNLSEIISNRSKLNETYRFVTAGDDEQSKDDTSSDAIVENTLLRETNVINKSLPTNESGNSNLNRTDYIDEKQRKELEESISILPPESVPSLLSEMKSHEISTSNEPMSVQDFYVRSLQRKSSIKPSFNDALNLNDRKGSGLLRKIQKILGRKSSNFLSIKRTNEMSKVKSSEMMNSRIEQDIQKIAISIASNVKSPDDWRIFSEEEGGVLPLVETIQEAAFMIEKSPFGDLSKNTKYLDRFRASISSAKVIRDVCALSPELASIITSRVLSIDNQKESENNCGIFQSISILIKYTVAFQKSNQLLLSDKSEPHLNLCLECQTYFMQLLLVMTMNSDEAVIRLRKMEDLLELVQWLSSYRDKDFLGKVASFSGFFSEPTYISPINGVANKLLASLGVNIWQPKAKNQKGLRILCLDGGGTRGIAAVTMIQSVVEALGGIEISDAFDMIAGTSTGAIIGFLIGLRRESSKLARKRYDTLIAQIFVKSSLSTPMLLFTTASYDEAPFMEIMDGILGKFTMLDSRADPKVPFVFAISSKMSSNPTQLCLFRNYNYNDSSMPDNFLISPEQAAEALEWTSDDQRDNTSKEPKRIGIRKLSRRRSLRKKMKEKLRKAESRDSEKPRGGSRHPGSFRVPQKVALRASTAAPTVFKPLLMGNELYCDGGIVASNPTAVAIHEARTLFPDIPIELVVSIGTGKYTVEKNVPRIGWDGIINQIVSSATDAESTHEILEDIFGGDAPMTRDSCAYYRFNPEIGGPENFVIDETDPATLEKLSRISKKYMNEPRQKKQLEEIASIIRDST